MHKINPLNAMFVGTADMNRLREYDLSADNGKNTPGPTDIVSEKRANSLCARMQAVYLSD